MIDGPRYLWRGMRQSSEPKRAALPRGFDAKAREYLVKARTLLDVGCPLYGLGACRKPGKIARWARTGPRFRLYEPAGDRNRPTAAGSAPAPSRRPRSQNPSAAKIYLRTGTSELIWINGVNGVSPSLYAIRQCSIRKTLRSIFGVEGPFHHPAFVFGGKS